MCEIKQCPRCEHECDLVNEDGYCADCETISDQEQVKEDVAKNRLKHPILPDKYCTKCYNIIDTDTYYGWYNKETGKPTILCLTCGIDYYD